MAPSVVSSLMSPRSLPMSTEDHRAPSQCTTMGRSGDPPRMFRLPAAQTLSVANATTSLNQTSVAPGTAGRRQSRPSQCSATASPASSA
ncbi:MAG: hypothetical protein DLM56_10810 [Pseudonocardiales bacterium]|nr:MAG: hypothetical protein DLM56_10810 [Pseudonocardiales bacterium]